MGPLRPVCGSGVGMCDPINTRRRDVAARRRLHYHARTTTKPAAALQGLLTSDAVLSAAWIAMQLHRDEHDLLALGVHFLAALLESGGQAVFSEPGAARFCVLVERYHVTMLAAGAVTGTGAEPLLRALGVSKDRERDMVREAEAVSDAWLGDSECDDDDDYDDSSRVHDGAVTPTVIDVSNGIDGGGAMCDWWLFCDEPFRYDWCANKCA